jgi:hypothetical protein
MKQLNNLKFLPLDLFLTKFDIFLRHLDEKLLDLLDHVHNLCRNVNIDDFVLEPYNITCLFWIMFITRFTVKHLYQEVSAHNYTTSNLHLDEL